MNIDSENSLKLSEAAAFHFSTFASRTRLLKMKGVGALEKVRMRSKNIFC